MEVRMRKIDSLLAHRVHPAASSGKRFRFVLGIILVVRT